MSKHVMILGQQLNVVIREDGDDRFIWEEDGMLCIATQQTAKHQIEQILSRWSEQEAKRYLTKRVRELSARTGLEVNRISFRRQRTRWGSCSIDKNISLNLNLYALPHDLIDYVIIHELAHTIEMNHSRAFWNVVAQHCPNYAEHRHSIRAYEQ